MIQDGDDGVVFSRGSLAEAMTDTSKAVEVVAAGLGLITPPGSYRTAFFEAFPKNPQTFIRGEGENLAKAEESAWLQFQKIVACPNHEFERGRYPVRDISAAVALAVHARSTWAFSLRCAPRCVSTLKMQSSRLAFSLQGELRE